MDSIFQRTDASLLCPQGFLRPLLGGLLGLLVCGEVAAQTTFYVAPSGSATAACTQADPCAPAAAQQAVRALNGNLGGGVSVQIADGIYRLDEPLLFNAADSGAAGNPVVWQAAPGAHPVFSGATQISGWSRVDSIRNIWAATVPAGSSSRQLFVDGRLAPIAQATPAQLGFGSWSGSATGYSFSSGTVAANWFAALPAAQRADVEFVWDLSFPAWTEWRCRVGAVSGSGTTITMAQPCWNNLTTRPQSFTNQTGALPTLASKSPPTTLRNAYSLLSAGEWYLDSSGNTLFYVPLAGEVMNDLDVELPHLETLIQGAGSLVNPLHDLTISGLTFTGATWNQPSTGIGFFDVQGNLLVTKAPNQGMCNYVSPTGSCPWAALDVPLAHLSFTGSNNISIINNHFTALGGVGVAFAYGSSNNLIRGNAFDTIAAGAIRLGCAYDPTPLSTTSSIIKNGCTPDPNAVAGDIIGSNETMTYNTVDNNLIHDVAADYKSSIPITVLFTQHTTLSHNDIFNAPYTGITAGILQGHVDNANHPDISTNVNADNAIRNNLIHDYLLARQDGGAIYIEGHQSQHIYLPGGAIDPVQTLAHGMQVTGNVVYNQNGPPANYYDDAGSEWINWEANVQFGPNPSGGAQGGCQPVGHIWAVNNYFSGAAGRLDHCAQAVGIDSHVSGTVTIPEYPKPGDIPNSMLANAGLEPAYRYLETALTPTLTRASPPTSTTPAQVFIAGYAFSPTTPVQFGGQPATSVQYISHGFLVATVPAGADGTKVSVGPYVPAPVITSPVNGATNLPSSITISGSGSSGDSVAITDTATSTALCSATVAASGSWSCAPVTLANGLHSLVAVQSDANGIASAPSATITINVGSLSGRINDTHVAITYSGWTYLSNRGLGDYQDDVHYATANTGNSATLNFSGSAISVYGEKYSDQGNIGIRIDGGTQVSVSTYASSRQTNQVVYSRTGLGAGNHTIVVTKLSGQYATLDGFAITP